MGTEHQPHSGPEPQPQTEPKLTWQKCLVYAEDCLIKAEQEPQHREMHVAQARYWNERAREQI
jgi:hypothetical protein